MARKPPPRDTREYHAEVPSATEVEEAIGKALDALKPRGRPAGRKRPATTGDDRTRKGKPPKD